MSAAALLSALERLPRQALAALPTPLVPASNLSQRLGIELWLKRDDLTGLALGGNKVRSAEYIVGDAVARGCTSLITTAAAQSNFCRVTAAAGRRTGLRVRLLLRGTGTEPVQGNLLLDRMLGAELRFTDDPDPYSPHTRGGLDSWAAEERAAGGRPYVIYIHGGSPAGALATAGYVHAALEIDAQCRTIGIRPDHLYVAVGSGSTAAGLLLGARLAGGPLAETQIVGACVGALSPVVAPKVKEFVRTTADLLRVPAVEEDVRLEDGQRGEAYGAPTPAALEAIGIAAAAEGLLLNPVYTGKAFAALLADVARGIVRPGHTVVFINTGGDPLVFAYAEALAAVQGATPH